MHELQLFPSTMPLSARRRRWIFLALWLGIGSMLVWPIYPFFAAASPRVLGLPLSFAWVVIALVAMFSALLWLFLSDLKEEREAADTEFVDTPPANTVSGNAPGSSSLARPIIRARTHNPARKQ